MTARNPPLSRLLRRCLFSPPSTAASFLPNPNRSHLVFFSEVHALARDNFEVKPHASNGTGSDLRRAILSLRFSRRNAGAVLDEWVRSGGEVNASELRRVVLDLRRARCYKHALEILSWKNSRGNFQLSAYDHATKLDLIAKLYGTTKAEEYFRQLDNATSIKAASFPLLHHFVTIRDLEKAETLMADLQRRGLALDQHLYNEMMKLYIAKCDFQKVFLVIKFMKINKIPFTFLSYNLWMNASIELCGTVSSVETILQEMKMDRNIEVGWSTHVTLANIYIKYGLHDKALGALRLAEETLSSTKRLGYSFVMTCYASLRNKKGIMRLWESSKQVPCRITCTDYITVMGCLLKLGDLDEAQRIFKAWEMERRKYDIRVPNVLLGAYVRNGLMEKAEKFHLYTLEKGAVPNYKTYEILMEGWVEKKEMKKAVDAMKKGFVLLRSCKWRPPMDVLEVIARYFENQGNIVEAISLVKVLRNLDMMSLPLYKSLVRTYLNAAVVPPDITLDMVRDGIEFDEEIKELIVRAKKMFSSNG